MTNKDLYTELERVSAILSAIDAMHSNTAAPFDKCSVLTGMAIEAGDILANVMNDMDLGVPDMPDMVSMQARPA